MKILIPFLSLFLFSFGLQASQEVSFSVVDIKPTCMKQETDRIINENDLAAAAKCFIETRRSYNYKNVTIQAKGHPKVSGDLTINKPEVTGLYNSDKVAFTYRFGFQSETDINFETYGMMTVKVNKAVKDKRLVKLTFCNGNKCENNAGFYILNLR